jgi:hypothetical protein
MQHDLDPRTMICRNCFRGKAEILMNYLACEKRPELSAVRDPFAPIDDTTTTPDLVVEPPRCSEASSPQFGP